MIIRGDEPIFIHRRTQTGVDGYGNPTFSNVEILVRDALFAYAGSDEPTQVERDPIDARLNLYLPNGTEVLEGDMFEIRGTMWVKDGDPQEWPTLFTGFVPGVVVTVRRRRG